VNDISGALLYSMLPAIPSIIRQGAKLESTNILAYFGLFVSSEEKRFTILTPGLNVIKLFTVVIYEFS
jgi:hypothetical protein